MSGLVQRLEDNAVEITSTLVTAIWLAALLTGQEWWPGALIVGYVAVIPIVNILAGEADTDDEVDEADAAGESTRDVDEQSTDDALSTLRERYARGELTDERFERKLERLLEVETVEDASEYGVRRQSRDRTNEDGTRDDGRERASE